MYDFKNLKEKIKSAEEWLKKEFMSLRTGIASPSVLDSIQVESYGSRMQINQLATVSVEGARALRITPYDKSQAKEIEKAITLANLGLSASVDDKGVRIFFPEITGEKRTLLIKTAKTKLEDAKNNIRRDRDETIKEIDTMEGVGEDDVFRYKKDMQKIVDEANVNLESLFLKKEKEINS